MPTPSLTIHQRMALLPLWWWAAAAAVAEPSGSGGGGVRGHRSTEIERQWARVANASTGPHGFRLALTGDPTEMLVLWTTPTALAAGQVLRYGAANDSTANDPAATSPPAPLPSQCQPELVRLPQSKSAVTMRCLCTGLGPATAYLYTVVSTAATAGTTHPGKVSAAIGLTPTLRFVSAPRSGGWFGADDYPLRMITFGDVDWTDGTPGDPPGSDPADVRLANKW